MRPRRTSRPLLSPGLDEADKSAIAAFHARYGQVRLTPVVVVIAAYEEEASIGFVLDELPAEACGLRVSCIVVVDGDTDGTGAVARARGAYVCIFPTNRGHGTALRVGYTLARDSGARFIVTTDADGQYMGSQIEAVLAPVVAGTADFSVGSRWLGRQETTDPVRRLGSRFFAGLATLLTGEHITDTSSGLRAMTAEVAASVTLRQPQYQTSELLMEALGKGFRYAEVPMTMRKRLHGQTKKGWWPLYGFRYARVLTTTWVRERRRRKRAGTDS
ncbi:MAG TPA: glycosyltransferase family 2 protein [Acidimicrobiia bacterium]|nr:glycosyltransferase family 2 protein [Acidimicrobiia bacterium]